MNSRIQKLLEEIEKTFAPEGPSLKEASSIEITAKNIDLRLKEADQAWAKVYWEGYKPAKEAAKDFEATATGGKERKKRDPNVPVEKKISDAEKVSGMKTGQIVKEIEEIASGFNKTVKENLMQPAAKLRATAEKIIEDIDANRAAHKEIVDPAETLLKPLYLEFYNVMTPAVNKYYSTKVSLENRIDEIVRRSGIEVVPRQRGGGAKREGDVLMTTTEYREKLVVTIEGATKIIAHGDKFAEKFEAVADLAIELGKTLPPESTGAEPPKEPEPKAEVPADEELTAPSSEMPTDGIDERVIKVSSSEMPMDDMEED